MITKASKTIEFPMDCPPTVIWAANFLVLQPLDFNINATKHWGLDVWDSHGTIQISNLDTTIEFNSGSITITPPGSRIHANFPNGRKSLYVAFGTSGKCKFTEPLALHYQPNNKSGEIEELTKNIIRIFGIKHYQANRILWNVLSTLTELPPDNSIQHIMHPTVQHAMEWITHNIENQFTVTELADILGTGQTQLSRLFRHHLNCTITNYIHQLRIHKACILLTQTTLSIKEVAVRAGIPDPQYFNKIIRKATGMPPSVLRQSNAKGFKS